MAERKESASSARYLAAGGLVSVKTVSSHVAPMHDVRMTPDTRQRRYAACWRSDNICVYNTDRLSVPTIAGTDGLAGPRAALTPRPFLAANPPLIDSADFAPNGSRRRRIPFCSMPASARRIFRPASIRTHATANCRA